MSTRKLILAMAAFMLLVPYTIYWGFFWIYTLSQILQWTN